MSEVARGKELSEEKVQRELLSGTVSELLALTAEPTSPIAMAARLIAYAEEVTRLRNVIFVFRDGVRLCNPGGPLAQDEINASLSVESRRTKCDELFRILRMAAVFNSRKHAASNVVRQLIGEDILSRFGTQPLLASRAVWPDGNPIALVAAFGGNDIEFIPEEELFLRHLCSAYASKVRSLVSQYFGDRFPASRVGSHEPFVEGRQFVVALFADVRGFTPFVSLFPGAREVTDGLRWYFEEASQVVFRKGGMVDKFMGDGLLALFGIGGTIDGEGRFVESACDAAIELCDVFDRARETYFRKLLEKRSEVLELRVGAGIDAGEALVGFLGGSSVRMYSGIGDGLNVASRLEGLAGKDYVNGDSLVTLGKVLVGGAAFRRLSKEYRTQHFDGDEGLVLTVKGKALPIRAHAMVR